MNLHYSQTSVTAGMENVSFFYHMNLHYSQTNQYCIRSYRTFFYHMNLHYSQTGHLCIAGNLCVFLPYEFTLLSNCSRRNPCQDKFFYHMNLHYSQTSIFKSCHYEARYISIWLSI